jgi:hypothetical protein
MKKYRVFMVRRGELPRFYLQKRYLGFLWWYDCESYYRKDVFHLTLYNARMAYLDAIKDDAPPTIRIFDIEDNAVQWAHQVNL